MLRCTFVEQPPSHLFHSAPAILSKHLLQMLFYRKCATQGSCFQMAGAQSHVMFLDEVKPFFHLFRCSRNWQSCAGATSSCLALKNALELNILVLVLVYWSLENVISSVDWRQKNMTLITA